MLATLGLLPMENIVEEEKNNEIFPTEINYFPASDTLITNDSLIVQVPASIQPQTAYLHILQSENIESTKLLSNEISLNKPGEIEYVILFQTD